MRKEFPLKIAVFMDSRPGHRKQTLGVVEALNELTPVRTVEIPVPQRSPLKEAMHWLQYFAVPAACCPADLAGCDLMLGTGSRTHISMLACRRKWAVPAVTCMTPSSLLRSRFDLCFVPQHDAVPSAKNIFFTDGPPTRSRAKNLHDSRRGLILIGGRDEKSHRWDDAGIIEAASALVKREKDIRWTIASSPRTPETTGAGLQRLAAGYANAGYVPFAETGPGWIESEYDRNRTVWVTADSVSMLFEALSAGCRVGVFPVEWKRKNNKFQRCIDDLCRRGLVVSFPAWREGVAAWTPSEPLQEARRCAKEILLRWWPDRLR